MFLYVIYAGIIFCAGLTTVISGFGFSTLSLPVLLTFLPFKVALMHIGIMHFVVNLFKISAFKNAFNRVGFIFIAGGVTFSFLAANLVGVLPVQVLKNILAVFLIVYPFFVWFKSSIHLTFNPVIAFLGGSLSGFFAGLIGTGGAIRSFFLSLFDLPKEMYIATGGLIALATDVTRLTVYANTFAVDISHILKPMLIGIPSLFVGLWAGRKMLLHVPQQYFRLFVSLVLACAGVLLLVK